MQAISPVSTNFKLNYHPSIKGSRPAQNSIQREFLGLPGYELSFGMTKIKHHKHPESLTSCEKKRMERYYSLLSNPKTTEQDLEKNLEDFFYDEKYTENEMQYLLNLGIRGKNKETFAKNYLSCLEFESYQIMGSENARRFINTKDLDGRKAVEIFADNTDVMEIIFKTASPGLQAEILKDTYSDGKTFAEIIEGKENSEKLKKMANDVIFTIKTGALDLLTEDIVPMLEANEPILDELNRISLEEKSIPEYHSKLSDRKTSISEATSTLKDFFLYNNTDTKRQQLLSLGINGRNNRTFAENYLRALENLSSNGNKIKKVKKVPNIQLFIDTENAEGKKAPEIFVGDKGVMEALFNSATAKQKYEILTSKYSDDKTLAEILSEKENTEKVKKIFNKVLFELSMKNENITRAQSLSLLTANNVILDERNKFALEALEDPACVCYKP